MGGDQDYSVMQDIARRGATANLLSAMLGRENAPRYQVKYATHNTHGCPAGVFIIPLQGHESKAAWEAALRQQIATVDEQPQVGSAKKNFIYINASPALIEALEGKAKDGGFASNFCDAFLAAVDEAQQAIEAKKAAARAAEASGGKDVEAVGSAGVAGAQRRFANRFHTEEKPGWWRNSDGPFPGGTPQASPSR